ncbi:MAG TPA: hypothetical protein PK849_06845, partial [Synergistales bacterium]|nr:hypothetical protein [Synergistales bacterium]
VGRLKRRQIPGILDRNITARRDLSSERYFCKSGLFCSIARLSTNHNETPFTNKEILKNNVQTVLLTCRPEDYIIFPSVSQGSSTQNLIKGVCKK